MAPAWPRNIVPYTEDQLSALADVDAIALMFDLLDAPAPRAALGEGRQALAERLLKVGLLLERDGQLHVSATHRRDPDGAVAGVLTRRDAMLRFAIGILTEGRAELAARREAAYAGVGAVTLPDRPAVLARAGAILAEAEDQLRALAEEAAATPGEPAFRALVIVAPAAQRLTKTPQ